MTRNKIPKKKLEVVFDPQKRKEFLTGFRKRKNERRKRAKEELERNLKEERKRIRQEIRNGIKHMKKSYEPLKEFTEADKAQEDEYEDDDVKVKIVELSSNDLAAQRNMLGENHSETKDESDGHNTDNSEYTNNANLIPGMDFDINTKWKRKSELDSNSENEDNEGYNGDVDYKKHSKRKPKIAIKSFDIKSKKELDHFKKTKTLKSLKKSKVFKIKERLNKKINQKMARRYKRNESKALPKHLRKDKKFEKNPYSKGRKMNNKQEI